MRHRLDASGLKCPMPVLKARRLLRDLPEGDELEILATDPGAPGDFTHFCEVTGYMLLHVKAAEGIHTIVIRKGAA